MQTKVNAIRDKRRYEQGKKNATVVFESVFLMREKNLH